MKLLNNRTEFDRLFHLFHLLTSVRHTLIGRFWKGFKEKFIVLTRWMKIFHPKQWQSRHHHQQRKDVSSALSCDTGEAYWKVSKRLTPAKEAFFNNFDLIQVEDKWILRRNPLGGHYELPFEEAFLWNLMLVLLFPARRVQIIWLPTQSNYEALLKFDSKLHNISDLTSKRQLLNLMP